MIKNKKVLIYGLGRSGIAAAGLLKEHKNLVFLYDDEEENAKKVYESFLGEPNIFLISKLNKSVIDTIDILVLSPGVRPNSLIKYAENNGKKVMSELELGFISCKNAFLAITGTNGKTTTCKILEAIFKSARKKVSAVGNIGVPVSGIISKETKKDVFACECSSFQLENILSFKPKIAAICNLAVDHLDWHKNEKEYINAKFNITKNQSKKDFLVLNKTCRQCKKLKTYAKVFTFGFGKSSGAYAEDDSIFFGEEKTPIMKVKDINLLGNHNVENVLCAITMAKLYGIKNKAIKDAIINFKALPHRLELIKTVNGINFINDSKATNIDSTIIAMKSIANNTVLLLGGSDKGYEYDDIFKNLTSNITYVVASGDTANKILEASKRQKFDRIKVVKTLKEATILAFTLAEKKRVCFTVSRKCQF